MINFIRQNNRQNDYLTKLRLYLVVVPLFILMPNLSLVSQVFDISRLEELQELQELQEETIETPTIIEDQINSERSERRKDKEFLEDQDNNFGFTGRRDFIISPQSKTLNKSLKYFGYDYFIDAPTTFAPVTDIPIPPDYILGPGDEIKVILFGNNNKQYTRKITRDGDIFFPEIGPISAAGLTFLGLKDTIQQIVDNQIIGTKVSLTLGALRSINIFVLGEASQPGMYTVSSLSTLTNAIFASGGIKTTGSLRNIQLKRKGKVLSTFDFYGLLLRGDTSDDQRLMPGDVVFIPPITKTVGIAGEVNRPGIYELKEGETSEHLINYAGTLKPKADLTSVEIQKIDSMGNGFNLTHIDFNEASFSDLNLSNGDVLTIYPVVNRMRKAILLSGHVEQPGFYPWIEGMRMLDVISSSENLLPMTDMNYVLIKREDDINQSYQVLQVDLEKLFTETETDQNIVLKEKDEIIFFPVFLTSDLITVKLIEGEYDKEDGDKALQAPTYTRKSLTIATTTTGTGTAAGTGTVASTPISSDELLKEELEVENKFYQYTIHDYCTISEEYVREYLGILEVELSVDMNLTNYCRRQLLDPIVLLLEEQGEVGKSPDIFDIYGNVGFPGRYPLMKGATLEDIFKTSGGINDASYLAEVEIIRHRYEQKELIRSAQIIAYEDSTIKTLIHPLDAITIRGIKSELGQAFIIGEVFFPGIYPITKDETLLSLIVRAGGLTDESFLKAAVLQRISLKEMELARLKQFKAEARRNILFSQQKTQTPGATNIMSVSELESILDEVVDEDAVLGRLIIDLESIMAGVEINNITIESGDRLTIPKYRKIVSVIGEVFVPNTHIFKESLLAEDYIQMSGGVTKLGDDDQKYIIKADGSVLPLANGQGGRFFKSNASDTLEPGDTIVLPIKLDQYSALQATTEITQIVYQMALAAAAVNSF